MKPIWEDVCDWARDRRYARLFLFSLFGVIGVLLVLAAFQEVLTDPSVAPFQKAIGVILLVVAMVAGLFGCRDWARSRRGRREGSTYSRLSGDELHKARSKLMNSRKRRNL